MLSLSEALANELKETGVTVTALCPGATRTGFQKRADMEGSRLVQREIMDPKTVAKAGYRALMKGQTMVIPGRTNWVLAQATRLVPRKVAAQAARAGQERERKS